MLKIIYLILSTLVAVILILFICNVIIKIFDYIENNEYIEDNEYIEIY
jgi:hypothetical protein